MFNAPLKSARRRNAVDGMDKASGLPTPPTAEQNQKKRTNHVLPKPDKFIRYRQKMSLNNFQNVEAAAGRAIPEFPRKLR